MKIKDLLRAIVLSFSLFASSIYTTLGQEIVIGFQDSINSQILNENRELLIRLPKDYDNSEKSYPVLYRLDGDIDLLTETVGVIHRLAYMEKLIPDMLVVMIKNTDRTRDMMPTNTSFYQSEPGGENFKKFIDDELVPYINSSYRTSNEKILCGQSLSSIFTLYYFLTSLDSFDSYIACSPGFPDCEDYFIDLTNKMLESKSEKAANLFMTNGLKDFLDPDGSIKKQIESFTKLIESKENIKSKYLTYDDEGHVPFQSLYQGLKFIYE